MIIVLFDLCRERVYSSHQLRAKIDSVRSPAPVTMKVMPTSLFSGQRLQDSSFLSAGRGSPVSRQLSSAEAGVPMPTTTAPFSDSNSQTLHSCVCGDPMWPFPSITACWWLISLVRSFAFIPLRRRKVGSSPDWKGWVGLLGQTSFRPADHRPALRRWAESTPLKQCLGVSNTGVSTADLQAYAALPFPLHLPRFSPPRPQQGCWVLERR